MRLLTSPRLVAAARAIARRYGDPRGWWVTCALSVLAAALRLPRLDQPHDFAFDETYYAKDAFSLLRFGYERAFVGPANELLLSGNTAVFRDTPAFVVHPPLGKWTIAIGEAVFGMNPFGWRIVMALFGIIAVALVHRITLRLTGMVHVAAVAGLFMAIDGMAIVLSRTALLDQTLMLFVLLTLWALVRDRDYYAHSLSLQQYVERQHRSRGLRPWRLLAIVFITCAFATKWSALWFAVAFAALALWWDARARRAHDVEQTPWLADLGWLLTASVIGVGGYLLSWWGWFRSSDAWDRAWTDGTASRIPQALRAFVHYHQQALEFHVNLRSAHPYAASPWGWLLQIRPTSFSYVTSEPGTGSCATGGPQCSSEVLALGNVVIWWFATAVAAAVVLNLLGRLLRLRFTLRSFTFSAGRRSRIDWDAAAAPLVGIAAGWLPWLYYRDRTTFTFYTIVFTPYMCMLAAMGLAWLATRRVRTALPVSADDAGDARTTLDVLYVTDGMEPSLISLAEERMTWIERDELHPRRFPVAVCIVILAIVFSAFALPIWTGYPLPYDAWRMRMIFGSWI